MPHSADAATAPIPRAPQPRSVGAVLATAALAAAVVLAPAAARAAALEDLPGARPRSPELRQQLAQALAERGPDYVPRTRNRHPDGSPRYANRLLLEASPYLQQHAHNPVDWYPWGDAAFEAAKTLGRPVLVSIGYATCHWCHVMEEESFDDPEIASYLNEHFIAIKVDREVRPDVDSVYMSAVLALGSRGGWPLNVFVTPDRRPFYGGTYFPPTNRGNRLSFANVLRTIVAEYADDPARIEAIAAEVAKRVEQQLVDASPQATRVPDVSLLERARDEFTTQIDATWGGIGRGMKFPSTVPVPLLLRTSRGADGAATRARVITTLERMASGGIHDHLGGGFHRYATDSRWLVPHFEKMLYDNALLARAYVEAHAATGREDFADVARRTLDYVAAEMTAPGGGFYSATDADSPTPSGEREEGRFFTWTPDEIRAAVGEADAPAVIAWFGVEERGRVEGRSVLHTWKTVAEVAESIGTTPAAVREAVARGVVRLRAARSERPPPLRDEKILAGWNGLMISAFARAATALDEPRYADAAARAADFVLGSMRRDGRLLRVVSDGRAAGPAFLEDYAFVIAGLLDLFEADGDPRWLTEAKALQATLDRHYADDVGGGYFRSAHDAERLLAREKPNRDGAVPSGNSIAAQNLLRLSALTLDDAYRDRALRLFSAFHDRLVRDPTQLPEMLVALDWLHATTKEVVLVAPPSSAGAAEMVETLRTVYAPPRVVVKAREGPGFAATAALVPYVAGKTARNGRTTAYVCENQVCAFPTSDPAEFAAQLRAGPTGAKEPPR